MVIVSMNGASVKFASQVNCYGVSLYASLNNESTDISASEIIAQQKPV